MSALSAPAAPGRERTTTPVPARSGAPATLDALVDATPATRERVVDLLRVLSIAVVVVWHWSLSLTQWGGDGALTMPNPIAHVPGGWALTWVLQVMPVFFVVGGYANLAGWRATTRDGGGARRFLVTRLRRLLLPVVPWLVCWTAFDLVLRAAGARSVLAWGEVLVVPLWFLAVYAGVVLAVPLTARLHDTYGWRVPAVLAAAALAADALRLGAGRGGAVVGLVGSAAVWLLAHQLGYFWRDGSLVAGGRRAALAVTAGGLGALVLLTTLGPYPRSMVSLAADGMSNMFPTTAAIAALATFQLGLALLARPWLDAWLRRRRPWRTVVAANAVAMPVFVWHMTALLAFLWLYEVAGFTLATEPSLAWWLTRPVWVVGPGLLLAALLAVFGRRRRASGSPAVPPSDPAPWS